jgi:hypothetical protein
VPVPQRQVARELDVSEYSLNLWKKAYLGQMKPAEIQDDSDHPGAEEAFRAPDGYDLLTPAFFSRLPIGQLDHLP